MDTDLQFARKADAADVLAEFRDEFHFPKTRSGARPLYFIGNSLGLQPKRARHFVDRELDRWAELAGEGHFDAPGERGGWYAYHELLTEPMARVVGAKPSEVVVMNSLTVNLHLMMTSFYRPLGGRTKILFEGDAFPSDRYAIQSQAKLHGLDPAEALVELTPREGELCLRTEDIVETIRRQGSNLALVLLGSVNYRTGQAYDLGAITAAAHAVGAKVGFDLAHGAGNLALKLHEWGPDFAVWCSYKYLNSGPGSLSGCFVHERHHRAFDLPRLAGWWGHDKHARFKMAREFSPMAGAEGWQLSNPPILPMAAMRASLELFERAGMDRLRAKSERLTAFLEFRLLQLDHVEIITPRDPAARGCHISFQLQGPHAGRGRALVGRLTEQGVFCDYREPDVIRVAPVPLYNSFEDVYEFTEILGRELGGGKRVSSPSNEVGRTERTLVGGGLVGSLLAVYLARRGDRVRILERRPDPRRATHVEGRSINLAISTRGLHALDRVGLLGEVLPLTIPMRGRMLHAPDETTQLQPYGVESAHAIRSLSRAALNHVLLNAAESAGAKLEFNSRVTSYDVRHGELEILDEETARLRREPVRSLIGTDGSASVIREGLGADAVSEVLGHGYKELTMPARAGLHAMEKEALHIWPRGRLMLIALPNLDGSFTCTLFLPWTGHGSFDELASQGPGAVTTFFEREFPDALRLIPDIEQQFAVHPTGQMTTVRTPRWSLDDRALLLGDAAHAIVPFFGQGMNCGFEDVESLVNCLDASGNDAEAFSLFFSDRKPNADAIATMALENFLEMSDRCADPRFQLERAVERVLAKEFPGRYQSRYSLVSFSRTPYAQAYRVGEGNQRLLDRLCAGITRAEDVDLALAAELLGEQRLFGLDVSSRPAETMKQA